MPDTDYVTQDSYTRREFLAELDVSMGGRIAEELIFGPDNVTSGAHSDIVKATEVAKRMVRHYGMSKRIGPVEYDDEDMQLLSTETKQLIEAEIKEFVTVKERMKWNRV